MEEPALTPLMDSRVLALPSGLAHSARPNSKVWKDDAEKKIWRDWEDEGGEVKRRSKDGWAERKWRNCKGRMKGVKWKYIDKGMNNLRD